MNCSSLPSISLAFLWFHKLFSVGTMKICQSVTEIFPWPLIVPCNVFFGLHSGTAGAEQRLAPCVLKVGLLVSVCSSPVSPMGGKTGDLHPWVFPKGRAGVLLGRVNARMQHEIKGKTWDGREQHGWKWENEEGGRNGRSDGENRTSCYQLSTQQGFNCSFILEQQHTPVPRAAVPSFDILRCHLCTQGTGAQVFCFPWRVQSPLSA